MGAIAIETVSVPMTDLVVQRHWLIGLAQLQRRSCARSTSDLCVARFSLRVTEGRLKSLACPVQRY